MLDSSLRPLFKKPLGSVAQLFFKSGFSANKVTVIGFGVGLVAFLCLFLNFYWLALVLILLNRLLDGVDGEVARLEQPDENHPARDLGGFLDIVSDFVFYAGCVLFFAIGSPNSGLSAAFLIFTFMTTSSTFLAYAIIMAKRNIVSPKAQNRSMVYIGGIVEGSETIIFLILMCLFPLFFNLLAVFFGLLCLFTAVQRVRRAVNDFGYLAEE